MRNPETAHWRDSARQPEFFIFDAYSALPFVFFLLHIRAWTFYLCCFVCLFFYALRRFGFTLPVFLRWLRCQLAGPRRAARKWYPREPLV